MGHGEVDQGTLATIRPKRRGIKPVFSVKVTKDGKIYSEKRSDGWKHLDRAWWIRKHPNWLWAAEKCAEEKGCAASEANILASILTPKPDPKEHHTARKKIYRKLAWWAGYKEREKLPEYIVNAVRWVYPEADEADYMGFKDE